MEETPQKPVVEPQSTQAVQAGEVTPLAEAQTAAAITEDEKFFAAVGYFGFFFVVPLIVKPKSAYCKFHAKQSMALFLVFILDLILLSMSRFFGSLTTLAIFAVYVMAVYRTYNGAPWNIPLISKFAGEMDIDAFTSIAGFKKTAQNLAAKTEEALKTLSTPSPSMPTPPAPPLPPSAQTPLPNSPPPSPPTSAK